MIYNRIVKSGKRIGKKTFGCVIYNCPSLKWKTNGKKKDKKPLPIASHFLSRKKEEEN